MNEQDIEIALKVIEERQRLQEDRLKDVDECCGKLKGTLNGEIRITNERIIKIEQSMDSNCKHVEIEMATLNEKGRVFDEDMDETREYVKTIDQKFDGKFSKITGYYVTFTLGILTSLAIGLIALIKW